MLGQGCGKNLRQPGDELFEPGKNVELYHKKYVNFMFLPLSNRELQKESSNSPATRLSSTFLPGIQAG